MDAASGPTVSVAPTATPTPAPFVGTPPAASPTATAGSALTPPSTSAPAVQARNPRRVTEMVLTTVLVVIIAGLTMWTARYVSAHFHLLFGLITLCGGIGGILYAVRDDELITPSFTERGIEPGWIRDAAYGVVGAFTICLLLPNFSESAIKTAIEVVTGSEGRVPAPPPDPAKATSKGADEGTDVIRGADLLEIIAVAFVGGFGGRSVLKRASDNLLHELKREQEQLKRELVAARADSEALALAAKQLNPGLQNPPRQVLRDVFARTTPDGRARVFDFVCQRLELEGQRVARQATALLEVLREVDPVGLGQQVEARLAQVRKLTADAPSPAETPTDAGAVDPDNGEPRTGKSFRRKGKRVAEPGTAGAAEQ